MQTATRRLLIIAHAPSPNTRALLEALVDGASDSRIEGVEVEALSPFDTDSSHVLAADGLLLMTPENLGYMSGALKDFFDRVYYDCLDQTQGKPFAALVRAGQDGTGTCRAIETITTGLRWRIIQPPLVCRGTYSKDFLTQAQDLGLLMSASLENTIV